MTTKNHPNDYETHANDQYVSHMPALPKVQLMRPHSPTAALSPEPHRSASTPRFLKGIDIYSCFHTHDRVAFEWNYSFRNNAQQILPFLYLAPRAVVKDQDFLQRTGITMIVTLRHAHPAEGKPHPASLNFAQGIGIHITVLDVPNPQALASTFSAATKAINDHMELINLDNQPSTSNEIKGCVLVCCDSGNDRSAAIVIAYLMEICGLSLKQAHKVVQDSRFCIYIDEALKQVLLSYETILEARSDVLKAENMSPVPPQMSNPNSPGGATTFIERSAKRSRNATSNEASESADEDRARFEGRDFAPFSS